MEFEQRFRAYYITTIVSIIISISSFSYNTWRLEVSEKNNTIRTASFEIIKNLAELEQVVFMLHYDKNSVEGSPRIGWVKIGLITDLSSLTHKGIQTSSLHLKEVYSDNWENIKEDINATKHVVDAIEALRKSIQIELTHLQ